MILSPYLPCRLLLKNAVSSTFEHQFLRTLTRIFCQRSLSTSRSEMKFRSSMTLLRRESRDHPEPIKPGNGWQVRHRQQGHDPDGKPLYLPERKRSELRAKASGPLLVLTALLTTWILSILFATRLAHIGLGDFKAFLALQFLLWTILRQGMSIIALLVFDVYYSSSSCRTVSIFGLDAWMSLIITPINIFRGKFLHVLLVLIPSIFSIFAAYATSGLLGRETAFELHEIGIRRIRVTASGGGSPHNYIMTGQEFVFNASQDSLASPNNRFVFVLEDTKVLVPSIPAIGTYAPESTIRAARVDNVPSVTATLSGRVESDRSIIPSAESKDTTVPSLGNVALSFEPKGKSSAVLKVKIILLSGGVHRQIYIDILYQTCVADILFATFNNGTHANHVFDVRTVSEELPARLNGSAEFKMESVLDNFIFSQNGASLLRLTSFNETSVQHLGLILASAFGIRSATLQNWLDGAGERDAMVFEEQEVVIVPMRYWGVAAGASAILAIVCMLFCLRRPTINGNLIQIVALLQKFIQGRRGACTPNWQKAYVEESTFEDRNMNQQVSLGYLKNENGEREVFSTLDGKGNELNSYRLALDMPENITEDKPGTLFGLLAG